MYNKYLLIIFSLLIGFYGTYKFNYINNPNDSNTRLQELILFMDDACFHIHHYMWLTLIIIALLSGKIYCKTVTFQYVRCISSLDVLWKDYYLKIGC